MLALEKLYNGLRKALLFGSTISQTTLLNELSSKLSKSLVQEKALNNLDKLELGLTD